MATSFKDMGNADLVTELARKQRDLVQAKFSLSMNRLENTASLSVLRKDIARIRTEIRRRELADGLDKDALVRAHRVDHASLAGGGSASSSGGLLSSVVDKLAE